jgi:beta-lactamase superfamily II metal-dependent hydrolase
MMASSRLWLLCAAVLLVAACPRRQDTQTPPPPTGKSFDAYLGEGRGLEKPEKPADTDDSNAMVIHFIDIGQGAAVLVEFPCGAMLIDTGGESNEEFDSWQALRSYLDAFFARRKDLDKTLSSLVITHPHLDHTRNIEAVLRRYQVENIVDNGAISGGIGMDGQAFMHEWVIEHDKTVGHQDINAKDVPDVDGLTSPVIDPIHGCAASSLDPQIRALWGGKESEEIGDDENDHSVVLRIDYGESSALLAGDVERLAIARLAKKFPGQASLLDTDIYQVPHHGSRYSTAAWLIEAVSPKVAVISCGPYERNVDWTARRYGHPHRETIAHLMQASGVTWPHPNPTRRWVGVRGAWKETPSEFEQRVIDRAIYATGWDGHVRVRANANGWIEVETEAR